MKMWSSFFSEDYGEPSFQGLDLSDLKVDEAFVQFSSSYETNLTVYKKSSWCYRCPFQKDFILEENENKTLIFDTNPYWSFLFSFSDQEYINVDSYSDDQICSMKDLSLGEFGVYELNVNPSYCDFKVLKKPLFIYGALILALVFFVLLGISYHLIHYLYKVIKSRQHNNNIKENNSIYIPEITIKASNQNILGTNQEQTTQKKSRVRSLDTFRGITIILMIFVNYGGGKYWFMEHAPWNGLHVADFVFPWFLWIMGVCIPMGIKSQLKRNTSKARIFLHILQRSVKLFAIGIILNTVGGYNQLETIRIPGVLQRFAVSYLVTSSIYLLCASPIGKNPFDGIFKSVADIVMLFPQWVIYILLVIGHTIFIFYMPIQGCPRGYLGPGGIVLLQNGKPSPDCIGGVTRMVDVWVLGENHMYQNPTVKGIYNTSSFDPEGILGCVTSLLQVFLGIEAGQILLIYSNPKSRLKRWLIWSAGTLVCSLALSSGIIIGGPIPVNKNLWSLSYVLITSSSAFLLLSICYFVVDYTKIWKGVPFYQTGMNSIFLYVGHYITYNVFPWRYKYGDMNSHLALLTEDLIAVSLWVIVAIYMFRKKIFFTV